MSKIRQLVLVFGDQLNHDSAVWDDFDSRVDRVWMAENDREATHVWCHQYRLVAFFAPMRHFRDELAAAGKPTIYHALPADRRRARGSSFSSLLGKTLREHDVQRVVWVTPGDYRVAEQIRQTVDECGIDYQQLPDRHFYCSTDRWKRWADGRRSLLLETFYRTMRKEHHVLIDRDGEPEGGQWNYDHDNRGSFGKEGPADLPPVPGFPPDQTTRDVIEMVKRRFREHPGECDSFDLPVTRDQARTLLQDFIEYRLPYFGTYQDAMWRGETLLYHSRLSHAMNLHLLSPRETVDAAVNAYRRGDVPLNATEGFVRQILGWREYVRGVYWHQMPRYEQLNALRCDPDQDVPGFFWDGDTSMACVADAMEGLKRHAYAHHIVRLMVLGLFAQLYGTHPLRFHQWHMAMYADAVDWVSLPNALGMSQYGDGGRMASKPYCASGKYIQRMSNYCRSCRFNPANATGEDACPFTTLYWDFLDRHQEDFRGNPRMRLQLKNLSRKSPEQWAAIRGRAERIRRGEIL